MAGDMGDSGLIPGSEDPLEEETATHSNIPALENPMDYRVAKSQRRLSDFHSLSLWYMVLCIKKGMTRFLRDRRRRWLSAISIVIGYKNLAFRWDPAVFIRDHATMPVHSVSVAACRSVR